MACHEYSGWAAMKKKQGRNKSRFIDKRFDYLSNKKESVNK